MSIVVSHDRDSSYDTIEILKKEITKGGVSVIVLPTDLKEMTKCVRSAKLMIVCANIRYQQSKSSRLEAEYAQCHRKDMVLVVIQENYQPRSWLCNLTFKSRFTCNGSSIDSFHFILPAIIVSSTFHLPQANEKRLHGKLLVFESNFFTGI